MSNKLHSRFLTSSRHRRLHVSMETHLQRCGFYLIKSKRETEVQLLRETLFIAAIIEVRAENPFT